MASLKMVFENPLQLQLVKHKLIKKKNLDKFMYEQRCMAREEYEAEKRAEEAARLEGRIEVGAAASFK